MLLLVVSVRAADQEKIWTEDRKHVMSALKTRFVPALRARGFVGSFPHLRRPLPDRVDYLTVQFYSSGGSFVVEVGRRGPMDLLMGRGKICRSRRSTSATSSTTGDD